MHLSRKAAKSSRLANWVSLSPFVPIGSNNCKDEEIDKKKEDKTGQKCCLHCICTYLHIFAHICTVFFPFEIRCFLLFPCCPLKITTFQWPALSSQRGLRALESSDRPGSARSKGLHVQLSRCRSTPKCSFRKTFKKQYKQQKKRKHIYGFYGI